MQNFSQKILEVVALTEAGELRNLVQSNIDHALNSSCPQLLENSPAVFW
jgi:hypothetical protein